MAMQEEPSREHLLKEIKKLRREVEILQQEKSDLNLLLETTTAHADSIVEVLYATSLQLHESNKRLQAEIRERQKTEAALKAAQEELQSLLTVISRDKADLEIMLDTSVQHGDLVEILLRNQCVRDPLTGLFNRRYMQEFLIREIHHAQRTQKPLGFVLLDIDHFRHFNNTFGHQAGDVVLQEVSLFLQKSIRKSDIACRYGGEEFVVILPEASLEDTKERAEQLRAGVKHLKLNYLNQSLGKVTLSAGIACFPEYGKTGAELIQAADMALYRAKALGRDRVVTAQSIVKELQPLIPSLPGELE
jgi:diguanylate cyclase (GGDEF)-like protein